MSTTLDVTNLGTVSTYDGLHTQQGNILYELNGTDISSGIVLELVSLDISNTVDVDPSFAELLASLDGLPNCQASLEFDVSLSNFQGLFGIKIDSSDVDDISSNDVLFRTNAASNNDHNDISDSYPVGKFFTDISFSESVVKSGMVNAYYADQRVKKDFVRHLAKEITGGYSSSDIFTNETQLIEGVSDLDAGLATSFNAIINADASGGYRDADSSNTMTKAARALYNLNLQSTDGSGGDASTSRSDQLLLDISAASANVNTDPSGNAGPIEVPLRFHDGDRIAVRLAYHPKGEFAGNGVTPSARTYKVLFRLVA